MLQPKKIHIPATLKFRPLPRKWVECHAAAEGWSKRSHYDTNYDTLSFTLLDGPRKGETVDVKLFEEHLPAELAAIVGEFERCDTIPESEEVRERLSGYRLPCLASVAADDAPTVATSKLATNGSAMPSIWKGRNLADPWEMRRDFFRCKPTAKDFVAFLDRWGEWDSGTVAVHDLVNWHRHFREARKPELWFRSMSFLTLETQREPPYFLIGLTECKRAIGVTISLDLLSYRMKVCAQCKSSYPVTSKHARKYCTHKCANLAAVNRHRGK